MNEDLVCCRCWCCAKSTSRKSRSSTYDDDDTGEEIINDTMIDGDLDDSDIDLDDDDDDADEADDVDDNEYGFKIVDQNDAEAQPGNNGKLLKNLLNEKLCRLWIFFQF